MRLGRSAAVSLGVLALAAPAAASGAVTASVVGAKVVVAGDDGPNAIHFTGRVNGGGGSYYATRIWDDDGPVTASSGCSAGTDPFDASKPVVYCGAPSIGEIDLAGNGGDDTIKAEASGYGEGSSLSFDVVTISGGPGNDTLKPDDSAGDGGTLDASTVTTVEGDDGDDTIDGGQDGPLTISGGPGNDAIQGGDLADVIHGNDGDDTIDGGMGDDKVYGDAGQDGIFGGSGSDLVDGGAGKDTLCGDCSGDAPGDDTIEAVDGESDTISCGYGSDTAHVDAIDHVDTTTVNRCESVQIAGAGAAKATETLPSGQRVLSHDKIAVEVHCSAKCHMGAYAKVSVGGAKPYELDSATYSLAKAGSRSVTLKLSGKRARAIKRALAHHKPVKAKIYAVITDASGSIQSSSPPQRLTINH